MTVHQKQDLITVAATADLSGIASRNKIVTIDGTICSAALTLRAAGVLWHGGEIGQGLSVVRAGVTKALAGEAVTSAGYPFKVANSGYLVNCTSGATAFGRFRETCNSGDLVPVDVNFASPFLPLLA